MNTLEQRNRKIRDWRRHGKTLEWIASQTDVTAERIRQICDETESKHDLYKKIETAYKEKVISEGNYDWTLNEIRRLSDPDRKKTTVIERRILIKYLHDKLGFSLLQIAQLLDRHHTSIMNLYYSKSI